MRTHPLDPLQEEIILTPTFAFAEWLKLRLASAHGVCAAVTVNLPGKVIWSLYRSILGEFEIPAYSATDREVLVWRLMRILPAEMKKPSYGLIQSYINRFGDDVLFKLSTQLAELFDQYQVYRADWLKSWEEEQGLLMGPHGEKSTLLPEEIWQSECWRAIVNDLSVQEQVGIRPHLHAKVMAVLNQGDFDPSHLPKRITLLGVSSLPMQNLEFFAALANYTQIFIGVHSPCQFHWAEIMEGREFFKLQRRRFKYRENKELATVDLSEMHLHANPLLSAWGRQNRDFIRQLDAFDDVQKAKEKFEHLKLDVFTEREPLDLNASSGVRTSVLHLIQDQIRDLEPLLDLGEEQQARLLACTKEWHGDEDSAMSLNQSSLVFHMTHGLTRELEVLHDQLLNLFDRTREASEEGWGDVGHFQPYDVLVMLPDLEAASPVIDAVFGQYDRADHRYISYSIADQQLTSGHPLIDSLKWLINLGAARVHLSDLLTVLKTPCIANQFGLKDNEFDQLSHWLKTSGMRWGLNQEHREKLGFSSLQELNSVVFGIRRMLLGFTNGAQDVVEFKAQDLLISPLTSVSGMDAELVGCFVSFVEIIGEWWRLSQELKTPKEWINAISKLMDQLIKVDEFEDVKLMQALNQALTQFHEVTQFASFEEPLSLKVVGSVWLDGLKLSDKRQRVLSTGVTFGSMKTMQGVPFKVICLVGMNEGDFPRIGAHNPFDLMEKKGQSRVGDRSKSQDDRSLMLQGLLCAREKLYISWSAFNDRDNSVKSPSVLVTQLRQYVQDKWSERFLASLTSCHPMQPFSLEYFKKDSRLQTYSNEWYAIHKKGLLSGGLPGVKSNFKSDPFKSVQSIHPKEGSTSKDVLNKEDSCTFNAIVRCLKNPVKDYFRQILSIDFPQLEVEQFDEESFGLDALETYQIKDDLLDEFSDVTLSVDQLKSEIEGYFNDLQVSGVLPHGPTGRLLQKNLGEELLAQLTKASELRALYSVVIQDVEINCRFGNCALVDTVPTLLTQPQATNGTPRLYMEVVAGRLYGGRAMRTHQLLRSWILSVIFEHLEMEVQMVILFSDRYLQITPPSKELADLTLDALANAYGISRLGFLPMPLKTAMIYAKDKDIEKAKTAYEGNDHLMGEVRDMSLERIYPEFDALIHDPQVLSTWVETFEPFWSWFQLQPKPEHYESVGSEQMGEEESEL